MSKEKEKLEPTQDDRAWELICSAADHVGADFDDSFAIFVNQPPRKHLCVNRLSYV